MINFDDVALNLIYIEASIKLNSNKILAICLLFYWLIYKFSITISLFRKSKIVKLTSASILSFRIIKQQTLKIFSGKAWYTKNVSVIESHT